MNHIIRYLFLLSILTLPAAGFGQSTLKKTKITKQISMLVPEDFVLMSRMERNDKYVSSKEPIVMYTSEDRNIDFGINLTNIGWARDDLELLKSFYRTNLQNLYSEVEFIQEDIREINGREYVVFELISKVQGENNLFGDNPATSKYTYIQYTLYNNQVMLFNFTCPARMRSQWQPSAKMMMESVKIDE